MTKLKLDFQLLTRCRDAILDAHVSTIHSLFVTDLVLDQAFCIVRLNTGWIGMAMNYGIAYEGRARMREEADRLLEAAGSDRLLLETLWNFQSAMHPFLRGALQTAVLSALTYPLVTGRPRLGFTCQKEALSLGSLLLENDSIAIIGLGGYLHAAMESPRVRRVFLSDLYIHKVHAQRTVQDLQKAHPEKELLVSDGSQNNEILGECQVACITASALPNGTLSGLLQASRGCREVILQGKSGSVFPIPLFDAGVTRVATYLVHPERWGQLSDWCKSNPQGNFAAFIDSNLREGIVFTPERGVPENLDNA